MNTYFWDYRGERGGERKDLLGALGSLPVSAAEKIISAPSLSTARRS